VREERWIPEFRTLLRIPSILPASVTMRAAIVDTGPPVAFLDRAEKHRRWVAERIEELDTPLVVCEPMLAEAMHLLARFSRTHDALFGLLENGALMTQSIPSSVSRASTSRSSSHRGGRATRHRSWPRATGSVPRSDGSRALTICKPSSLTRWHGSASYRNVPADRRPPPWSAALRAVAKQPCLICGRKPSEPLSAC
jgi:hypothetical protein